MFISNAEKAKINDRIQHLEKMVRDLNLKMFSLKEFQSEKPKKQRKIRHQSEESRAAQSKRMKEYWANKKLEKQQ